MAEMPGMIRPDLQALPQVRDRMTFLYLEHCTLGRQDGAITVTHLFPAHAGVIPDPLSVKVKLSTFPRMRGGDPQGRAAQRTAHELFPACAGVILLYAADRAFSEAFPRMRGGDPQIVTSTLRGLGFSPHARG